MNQKPYLNLGCGRIILPGPRPAHHNLVNEALYDYPLWLNVDRNAQPGVDEVVDLFTYPWPWPDNSFDGALLTHLVEHIPHDIKLTDTPLDGNMLVRQRALAKAQDGWYAFFAELHRVLTPGARAHIVAPYGWSQGAITDPTHTRLITEHTFAHSMRPDPDAPFAYTTLNLHFEQVSTAFRITELYAHLLPVAEDDPATRTRKEIQLQQAFQTSINVAYEVYTVLEAVKDAGHNRL